jgi:hypothetical protein
MSILLNLHNKLAYILYFKAIKKAIRILDKIKKYFCALFLFSSRAWKENSRVGRLRTKQKLQNSKNIKFFHKKRKEKGHEKAISFIVYGVLYVAWQHSLFSDSSGGGHAGAKGSHRYVRRTSAKPD